jgi:hypothetical protein
MRRAESEKLRAGDESEKAKWIHPAKKTTRKAMIA